jgi:hypothetical protein
MKEFCGGRGGRRLFVDWLHLHFVDVHFETFAANERR